MDFESTFRDRNAILIRPSADRRCKEYALPALCCCTRRRSPDLSTRLYRTTDCSCTFHLASDSHCIDIQYWVNDIATVIMTLCYQFYLLFRLPLYIYHDVPLALSVALLKGILSGYGSLVSWLAWVLGIPNFEPCGYSLIALMSAWLWWALQAFGMLLLLGASWCGWMLMIMCPVFGLHAFEVWKEIWNENIKRREPSEELVEKLLLAQLSLVVALSICWSGEPTILHGYHQQPVFVQTGASFLTLALPVGVFFLEFANPG